MDPGTLKPGPYTSDLLKQGHADLSNRNPGSTLSHKGAAASWDVYGIKLSDGSALIFTTANDNLTVTANPGREFTQDPKRSNLGGLIPPGQYTRSTAVFLEMAAIVDPGSTGGLPDVVGFSSQAVQASAN